MIGIDSNVLIRHLAQDDPVQSPKATAFIERGLSADEPGFISSVVLVETAWVLERVFRLSNDELIEAVERLLQTDAFVVQHIDEAVDALEALKARQGSFSDALIGALARKAGCSRTVTFDKEASRLPGFDLL